MYFEPPSKHERVTSEVQGCYKQAHTTLPGSLGTTKIHPKSNGPPPALSSQNEGNPERTSPAHRRSTPPTMHRGCVFCAFQISFVFFFGCCLGLRWKPLDFFKNTEKTHIDEFSMIFLGRMSAYSSSFFW